MESKNFKQSELTCKCGCGFANVSLLLLANLELMRAKLDNKPIIIVSACRCYRRNRSVGGTVSSYHLRGMASDIFVKGVKAGKLETLALECPGVNGIGRDDETNVLHIDVREGRQDKWCYEHYKDHVDSIEDKKRVIPYYPIPQLF